MTKNIRITYRRRSSYRTRSNKVKAVRTPGGKLVAQYIKKKSSAPKCGDCKCKIQGVPSMRPAQFKHLTGRKKSVARAYGGSRCAACVRSRIVRAFLIEEQKIVKRVVAAQKKKEEK
mmetsp:Transcript_19717/g.35083  ORF Transcript_19717/g.35083 Transcript_19717/m.35083 type:complete len:117 (+) Transcript_19717:56-406(+)|eukprot:CAMPEP_0184507836 /NCGR_PEP_ID=MMETSP0198_2-20121128/446_1 /TAXON_ID=1112570 /ORGANISM="Thraustochytrium sp., Strain LLF1b" /LENGTH=116 /DNA_ID=CAMNT_0026897593 /DNA_START=58 /DNA_END=408 /DNA_ORIENTATION=-